MEDNYRFDYYYGYEAEQFSFYRIPRMLIKDARFRKLSSDAKILYGLMLDRMSLSVRNGWMDGENRAYIHYTIENIMEDLGCARATCIKILAELDGKKGIGLIEKQRQGQGRPDRIYVKNFVGGYDGLSGKSVENKGNVNEKEKASVQERAEVQNMDFMEKDIVCGDKGGICGTSDQGQSGQGKGMAASHGKERRECHNLDSQKFKNDTTRSSKSELLEVQELNCNYNNNNYTDSRYIYPIYPINLCNRGACTSVSGSENGMGQGRDTSALMEAIKTNLDYEGVLQTGRLDKELYRELFGIICDVVFVERETVRIGGNDYPYKTVKERFLHLDSSHLEYVIRCMENTTTKINNIRAYMMTALYNAPDTIRHYYQQEVQHDMYRVSKEELGN